MVLALGLALGLMMAGAVMIPCLGYGAPSERDSLYRPPLQAGEQCSATWAHHNMVAVTSTTRVA